MDTECRVYQYMLEYQRQTGEPPTMRDIVAHIKKLNYRSSARFTLLKLEEKGLAEQTKPPFMSRRWRACQE